LSGKRDELGRVVANREAEEAALASLGDAIAKSKSELEALRTLPQTIGEAKAKCEAVVQLAAQTASDLKVVSDHSNESRTNAAAVDASVQELRVKLEASKAAAESHERDLGRLAEGVAAAQGISSAADAEVEKAKAALELLTSRHSAVDAATEQLDAVAKDVEAKLAQADAAIKRLEQLQAQRSSQFEEIVFKLTPLVGVVGAQSAP